MSTNAKWEALRRQFRQLETEIDSKILEYGRMATALNSTSSHSAANFHAMETVEMELEAQLKKMAGCVEELARCIEQPQITSTTTTTTSAPLMHSLQRHRDINYDYLREFQKIRANIQQARDHSQLLSSPTSTTFPTMLSDGRSQTNRSQMDSLLNERRKIDNVSSITDSVLDAAAETRSALFNQRQSLLQNSKRLGSTLSRLPGINTIIHQIQVRRKRDSLIVGAVIGLCLVLIIWYRS